jgi:hypothetical protein
VAEIKRRESVKNFPKEVFIKIERPDNDDPYLVVTKKVDGLGIIDQAEKVAIYKFDRIVTVENKTTIKE